MAATGRRDSSLTLVHLAQEHGLIGRDVVCEAASERHVVLSQSDSQRGGQQDRPASLLA